MPLHLVNERSSANTSDTDSSRYTSSRNGICELYFHHRRPIPLYNRPMANPSAPSPTAATAPVCAGAAPVDAAIVAALVRAGTDVVRTTVPEVVTMTDPDADANDEATDDRMLLADAVL
jgi:hypothetical protein